MKSICQDDTMEKCSLVEENRTQIVALKPEKPELSGRPHDPIEMPAHCCPAVKRFVFLLLMAQYYLFESTDIEQD